MTAQMGERLLYKGKNHLMTSLPFRDFLKSCDGVILNKYHTANYRGYFGNWEVKDNKLFLIELHANVAGTKGVELDYFFPEQSEVFAYWFSGKIKLQKGEILEYIHHGFGSVYEKEIHLFFKNGILIDESELDNREKYPKVEEPEPKKSWWSKIVKNILTCC